MKGRALTFVPVVIEFPEHEARSESWGRFLDLSPTGARLMTRTPLRSGDTVHLSFELPGGGCFKQVRAGVVCSARDEDGYRVCRVRFSAAGERVRLGRALRALLRLI
ncbi:MAG: PilZ domain-containing protein [Elusimicrobiota bacterium]